MNEYRCTRPDVYGSRTPGHTDLSARQGYYIVAESHEEARRVMKWSFPDDMHFDVALWKENVLSTATRPRFRSMALAEASSVDKSR